MNDITIPQRVVCNADHCQKHDVCSRYTNYIETLGTEVFHCVLNTSLVTIGDEGCQYLHIPTKVTVAHGFKNIYLSVPKIHIKNLWKRFPGGISRRQFYRLLNGEVSLMPEQQEEILNFFNSCDANTALGFDRYEDVEV